MGALGLDWVPSTTCLLLGKKSTKKIHSSAQALASAKLLRTLFPGTNISFYSLAGGRHHKSESSNHC